ncbi:calcium/proton exchanger [Rhizophagus irregularis]|uniref:Vacuolar calcium ion transporter n=1 Tax=Rhizophagus irregularis TaxID=588596 RepID=A0A2N1P309_9GLOM|nr:calcium/proton exchanger [Rhizophagus irregularis]
MSTSETLSLVPNYSPGYGSTPNEDTHNTHKPSSSQTVLHTSPPTPTIRKSIKIVLTSSKINILLIFIPLGYLAHIFDLSDNWVFILNFLAIIPLAKLLDFATEELSLRVGETIGGFLNATFGNAVELIVSVVALMEGEIRVVQASILGSIISNLLLILGMCFVAGGIYHEEQKFNQTAAQTTSSLMTLACIGLIIPAAFNFAVGNNNPIIDDGITKSGLLDLSRGTAVVLLIIYILYLYFQMKTHSNLYQGEEEEDDNDPQFSLGVSIFLLASITVIVSFSADYLVGSIEGIVESSGLSKTFVGLILIPIVGNAAEFVTAINAAMRNKMDLAVNVSAGSSMQIALFVTPFLVLLGWAIGQDMSLYFQSFETVVLFISILITNYLIQDGKSNWLEGVMLLATYIIISLAFFFYPNDNES